LSNSHRLGRCTLDELDINPIPTVGDPTQLTTDRAKAGRNR
jgi:hypothetical protein